MVNGPTTNIVAPSAEDAYEVINLGPAIPIAFGRNSTLLFARLERL